jgi:hypothetical protein
MNVSPLSLRGGLAIFSATAALTLSLAAPALAAPPANDNFANRQTIGPALPISIDANNDEATAEPGEPNISGSDDGGGRSLWYEWTPSSDADVRISACGAFSGGQFHPDLVLGIYTGTGLDNLVEIRDTFPNACYTSFSAVAGTSYKILVESGSTETGAFHLQLAQASVPDNDDFADAQEITTSPTYTASSTLSGTAEAGEPAHNGVPAAHSIWYRWTATDTGKVRISAQGSVGEFRIGVYDGYTDSDTEFADLTRVDAMPAGGHRPDQVTFNAVSGHTYVYAIDSPTGSQGDVSGTFRVLEDTVANDDYANAQALPSSLPVNDFSGSIEGATAETGEPMHAGRVAQESSWFKWTAGSSGLTRIDLCEGAAGFGFTLGTPTISVYTGTTLGNLVPVKEAPGCALNFPAVPGTSYSIAIDSGGRDPTTSFDQYEFEIDMRAASPPANDDFANSQVIGPGGPISVTGTTVDATSEIGENNSNTVWYSWTPAADQRVTLGSCAATSPDDYIYLFTGGTLAGLSEVDLADYVDCESGAYLFQYDVHAGTTYRVQVSTANPDGAAFTLAIPDAAAVTPPSGGGGGSTQPTNPAPPAKKHKKKHHKKKKKKKH